MCDMTQCMCNISGPIPRCHWYGSVPIPPLQPVVILLLVMYNKIEKHTAVCITFSDMYITLFLSEVFIVTNCLYSRFNRLIMGKV